MRERQDGGGTAQNMPHMPGTFPGSEAAVDALRAPEITVRGRLTAARDDLRSAARSKAAAVAFQTGVEAGRFALQGAAQSLARRVALVQGDAEPKPPRQPPGAWID